MSRTPERDLLELDEFARIAFWVFKIPNLFLDFVENFLPELLSSDPKTCFFPNWKLETGNWKLEIGNTD